LGRDLLLAGKISITELHPSQFLGKPGVEGKAEQGGEEAEEGEEGEAQVLDEGWREELLPRSVPKGSPSSELDPYDGQDGEENDPYNKEYSEEELPPDEVEAWVDVKRRKLLSLKPDTPDAPTHNMSFNHVSEAFGQVRG
jgi:hypothetical protein